MPFGDLNLGLGLAPQAGAGVVPPSPAPAGWQWVVLTERNENTTESIYALMELQRIAA